MKRNCKKLLSLLLAMAAVAGSLFSEDLTYSFPRKGRFILPPSASRGIFRQCSRSAPSAKSETWAPTEKDIDELESLLRKYLKQDADHVIPPKGTYHRQYVGFVKDGERYIYGNFYTSEGFGAGNESKSAVVICDGGEAFWGIVYRIRTKTFEDLQFNGQI